MFTTQRIYDDPRDDGSYRVLVDRIWPRGISKDDARLDDWLKDLAPSNELRKWFGHDPEKWPEFRKRYFGELRPKDEIISKLLEMEKEHGHVTLLYAAKDEEHNNARALMEYIT